MNAGLWGRDLSKWPQMLVTGSPIPPNDALEIIRRTDGFFSMPSGNDREFVERAIRLAHMPECPDGIISFSSTIGKWPTIRDVYDDWALMAKEFPFLEAEVSIMDAEKYGEDHSFVVSMLIRDGKVTLVDPAERNFHEEFHRSYPKSSLKQKKFVFSAIGSHAITLAKIKKWGDQFEESKEAAGCRQYLKRSI